MRSCVCGTDLVEASDSQGVEMGVHSMSRRRVTWRKTVAINIKLGDIRYTV